MQALSRDDEDNSSDGSIPEWKKTMCRYDEYFSHGGVKTSCANVAKGLCGFSKDLPRVDTYESEADARWNERRILSTSRQNLWKARSNARSRMLDKTWQKWKKLQEAKKKSRIAPEPATGNIKVCRLSFVKARMCRIR